MANILAAASGNWSATGTWTGGVMPGASDVVYSNGFTVAIDQNITVVELRADANGVATAGGGFTVTQSAGTTRNITAKLTNSNVAFALTGTAVCNIVGDVSSASTNAWSFSNNGTINVTGNVTSSSSSNVLLTSGVSINITGNVTATGGAPVLLNNTSSPSITVVGTVTGGTAIGLSISSGTGSITVVGSAVGGSSAAGVSAASGTVTVTRAVGGTGAPGVAQSGSGTAYVEEVEYGSTGFSPTSGLIRLTDKTNNKCLFFRQGLSKKTVSDIAGLGVLPAVTDVRSGVTYNSGQLTGTCAVPAAGSVASGVSVDATTGTAILTSTAIQSACAAALTAFASGRLADVATTATTGQQIADATF